MINITSRHFFLGFSVFFIGSFWSELLEKFRDCWIDPWAADGTGYGFFSCPMSSLYAGFFLELWYSPKLPMS